MAVDIEQHPPSPALFEGVRYFINDSVAVRVREQLDELLRYCGGQPVAPNSQSLPESDEVQDEEQPHRRLPDRFDLQDVTHVITDTTDFPEYKAILDLNANQVGRKTERLIEVVRPSWVTRSFDLNAIANPSFYSPDKSLFFSTLKFCCEGLPPNDEQTIKAAALAFGGQYTKALSKDTTHLIVVAPGGPDSKYQIALEHGGHTGLVIVMPQWFEESLKLMQPVSTELYEFPDPPFQAVHASAAEVGVEKALQDYYKKHPPTVGDYKSVNSTIRILGHPFNSGRYAADEYVRHYHQMINSPGRTITTGNDPSAPPIAPSSRRSTALHTLPRQDQGPDSKKPFLSGRRFYLASDLQIRPGIEDGLVSHLEKFGATVWSYRLHAESPDESTDEWAMRRQAQAELDMADTVIISLREGWEYWHAYESEKAIGNLAWIYHVLAKRKLDSPLDRLLHYPTPAKLIPELKDQSMTVTNYSGAGRDYVRAMIELTGGKFDGSMTRATPFVISASDHGEKVQYASMWGATVINHLWLEDCITRWEYVRPDAELKYKAAYMPTRHFATVLGTCALPREAIKKWAKQPEIDQERQDALKPVGHRSDPHLQGDEGEEDEDGDAQMRHDLVAADNPSSMTNEIDREEAEQSLLPKGPKTNGTYAKSTRDEIFEAVRARTASASPKRPNGVQKQPASSPRRRDILADEEYRGREDVRDELMRDAHVTAEDEHTSDDESDRPNARHEAVSEAAAPAREEESSPTSDSAEQEAAGLSSQPVIEIQSPKRAAASEGQPTKRKGPAAEPGPSVANVPAPAKTNGNHAPKPASKRRSVEEDTGETPACSKAPSKSKGKEKALESNAAVEHTPEPEPRPKAAPKKRRTSALDDVISAAANSDDAPAHEGDSGGGRRAGRKAAANAVKKISSNMDDANRYAQQLKGTSSKKRSHGASLPALEGETNVSEDTPSRDGKRAKGAVPRIVEEDGNVSSFDRPPNGKPLKKLGTSSQFVRIWSTGLEYDTDSPDIQKLMSIGARWSGDNPRHVTHMIVNSFVRTEKFLSCLPYAEKFVTQDWVAASIKAKRLVDETPYLLKDKKKEREIGDTLEAILARASKNRAAGRGVFTGKTFYVTSKALPGKTSAIQNLITLGGGTVSKASLKANTDAILNDPDAIVISSEADRSKWDFLAAAGVEPQPKPIYTSEVIFLSMQHQKLRLDENERLDPRTYL